MLKWYTIYLRQQLRSSTPRHSLTNSLNFKGGKIHQALYKRYKLLIMERKLRLMTDTGAHSLYLVDNGIIYLNTQGNQM